MHLCRDSLVWLLLCWTHFHLGLGAEITNFTECINQGNHMSLDMPIRCLDSKTGKLFFGDVNQIYMKLNMLEKIDRAGEIRHETPCLTAPGFCIGKHLCNNFLIGCPNFGTFVVAKPLLHRQSKSARPPTCTHKRRLDWWQRFQMPHGFQHTMAQ